MNRWLGLLGAVGVAVAWACTEPHPVLAKRTAPLAQEGKVSPQWLGPWVSGAWYDTARSGEGIIVQFLADGRALAVWFTYPPSGEPGRQAWLLADGGRIDGDTLRFDRVIRPQGARFGAAFDPATVQLNAWGTMSLRFTSCVGAQLNYAGPAAFGSGSRALSRLTTLDEIDCDGARKLTPRGARRSDGLRAKSGAWFVPSRSGEGWMVEELPDGRAVVYWFTYDPEGNQAWTFGTATRQGESLLIEDNLIARGTRFGNDFNANDVRLEPWGRLRLDFSNCQNVAIDYASPLAGYGAATRNAVRLTALGGAPCLDPVTSNPQGLAFVEKAISPAPFQSEHAIAIDGSSLYVLGGFGKPRAFRRYDAASNTWTELPDLPAGRDHPAAFALAGGVYMAGGAANGGGDQATSAFRYDIAAGTWSPVPELVGGYGSHATVLFGRAYIGLGDGALLQFDPVSRRTRLLRPSDSEPRDHSQVVAYLDEIWSLGGRIPETTSVSIYDPVSERWRAGPAFRSKRGGFAAAVVGPRLVIAGGEVIDAGLYVEASSEILGAGANAWEFGPDLPVPVHGTIAGGVGNRFILISGSTIAGQGIGRTGRVFEMAIP